MKSTLSSMGSWTVTSTGQLAVKPPPDTVITAVPPAPSGAITTASVPLPSTRATAGSSELQTSSGSSVVSAGT